MSAYTSKYNGSQVDSRLDAVGDKQAVITDLATIAFGYGTCSTASGTAAKTVSMSNFVLLNGGIVSVLFTNGITSANSTLNVNSTGAKPIYYHGAALTGGVITNKTVATLQYSSTNNGIWHIIGLEKIVRNYGNDWVDMGLPSGTLWAKKNVDLTQTDGFTVSEYQYECSFFSFGNTDGHYPTSTTLLDYSFCESNYNSTTGKTITSDIYGTNNDPVVVHLERPWRMPTRNEWTELFQYSKYIDANGDAIPSSTTDKRITLNSIVGIYLKSNVNDNTLFIPCCGCGIASSSSQKPWDKRGTGARYWSGSNYSNTSTFAYSIDINTSGAVNYNYTGLRYQGYAIRPVM